LDPAEDFSEFARTAAGRLCRTAYLLCGDWHTAQDLTQTTLAKVFVSWRRIERRDGVHAYAHRTLVNSYLAMARRRSFSELPVATIPDAADQTDTADLRIVLLQALASLTPRDRTVVILRYWEDRSADQVAELLGCSPGNVRVLSCRALQRLRGVLGDTLPGHGPGSASSYQTLPGPAGEPAREKDTAHG
jgi:RNA polymerase sigma-70 factor (sigma-E family)